MANTMNRQERQLEQILQLPGNNVCADCKAPSPRWASINLAIFLCITCASIHRSLGTHTSRVKSLSLDTWTREMVEAMRKGGNVRGNAEWNPDEVRNPVPLSTVGESAGREGEMERFIRRKYEEGAFRADRAQRRERALEEETTMATNKSRARQGQDVYGYSTGSSLLIPTASAAKASFIDNNASPGNDHLQYNHYPQSVAGPSSFTAGTGKKTSKTARAHVDANWADFMDSVDPPYAGSSLNGGNAKAKGRGKKAGRLLGMPFIDSGYDDDGYGEEGDHGGASRGGGVRLPPVTKAPKGLAYKTGSGGEGKAVPPPPLPPKTKLQTNPRPSSIEAKISGGNSLANGTAKDGPFTHLPTATPTPTPAPALIDITQPQIHPGQSQAYQTQPMSAHSQQLGMVNPYNPFMQMQQPQFQQAQYQQTQFPQPQFPPQFQQPQMSSYGGQQMQPGMGMSSGMMMHANGTVYQQQYHPALAQQQQPMYAGQQQMGGYVNGQGGQMMGYGQSQMGQSQQMQHGQSQMGQMQGQGMMGWQ
ncbi:hypothetical protein QFC21_006661 [Naganishia friedmannii]|uniref:Uncharacterized protein n=1 Tax=Naganishia friedmannii TaxID=89922 RepID=A0ACC2V292_9TREE|nr:hypothetical protein QFC21_006661 [Naganishia friedmannii]